MKIQIAEKVHTNSHVAKLGWEYPILIMNRTDHRQAVTILEKTFGRCAKQYNFHTYGGPMRHHGPTVRDSWKKDKPLTLRFFSGNRMWNARGRVATQDFWVVFKTDKDRTLALMLLE